MSLFFLFSWKKRYLLLNSSYGKWHQLRKQKNWDKNFFLFRIFKKCKIFCFIAVFVNVSSYIGLLSCIQSLHHYVFLVETFLLQIIGLTKIKMCITFRDKCILRPGYNYQKFNLNSLWWNALLEQHMNIENCQSFKYSGFYTLFSNLN